jgi:hypothetical protein
MGNTKPFEHFICSAHGPYTAKFIGQQCPQYLQEQYEKRRKLNIVKSHDRGWPLK